VGECPAGEIVQIFSKSFKFISRQNDSNPINPPNLLNHPKGICLYKISSCGTIERIEQLFLTTNYTNYTNFWLSWRKPRPDGFPRAAKALPIREIREIRGCRNKSVKSAKSVVLFLASVFCLRQTQVFTSEPELVVLVLSKYGHSAFNHLCWVPVMVGVGCANLSPLGSSDALDAHVGE